MNIYVLLESFCMLHILVGFKNDPFCRIVIQNIPEILKILCIPFSLKKISDFLANKVSFCENNKARKSNVPIVLGQSQGVQIRRAVRRNERLRDGAGRTTELAALLLVQCRELPLVQTRLLLLTLHKRNNKTIRTQNVEDRGRLIQ